MAVITKKPHYISVQVTLLSREYCGYKKTIKISQKTVFVNHSLITNGLWCDIYNTISLHNLRHSQTFYSFTIIFDFADMKPGKFKCYYVSQYLYS